ncbi:hypothetical protein, partial [Bradyrhizobium cosmicum]|uniref:hypothetical protein n=1 Tax=Bradyrhizobium cosmicum TaxID=1404864 RepID=UPI0028EB4D2C
DGIKRTAKIIGDRRWNLAIGWNLDPRHLEENLGRGTAAPLLTHHRRQLTSEFAESGEPGRALKIIRQLRRRHH